MKLKVDFCHLPTEMKQMCQAAYCLAQKPASSADARRLEDLGTAPTDLDNPVYQEALALMSEEVSGRTSIWSAYIGVSICRLKSMHLATGTGALTEDDGCD